VASIAELLGGYRKRLPPMPVPTTGPRRRPREQGSVADFAEQCHALGYRAFKVHGWNDRQRAREARTCPRGAPGRATG